MNRLRTVLLLVLLCAGSSIVLGQNSQPKPSPTPALDDFFKSADFDEMVKKIPGQAFNLDIVMAPEKIEEGKLDEAIATLTKAIADTPDAWALAHRAMAYYLKNDLARAISDANVALSMKPNYPRALNVKALVERSRGQNDLSKTDFENAVRVSTEEIKRQPDTKDGYYQRGETFRFMGENAKAAADYRKTLDLTPGYPHAQARLDLVTGSNAKPLTKTASNAVPQPTPSLAPATDKMAAFKKTSDEYSRLNALLTGANDRVETTENALMAENKRNGRNPYSRSDSDLTICTQLHDADELYSKTFSEFYDMQMMSEAGDLDGRPDLRDVVDEAEYTMDGVGGYILIKQSTWKCPKESKIAGSSANMAKPVVPLTREDDLSYRTKLAIDNKATDGMLAELNAAIAKSKKDALAFALRGDIFMAKASVLLARADYNQAIKLDGKKSLYYYKRGHSFESSPDYSRETANQDYSKALELDPDNADALRDRGYNYSVAGNNAAAMADLVRATQLKPDDHQPHYWLARLYVKANDVENALAEFTRSIETKPDDPYPYVERGQVYEFLKRYDEAILDYSKVVMLMPNEHIGYGNRADVYVMTKHFALAEADYTKGIDLNKSDASSYVQRARFYTKWGKYDEALADYETATTLAAYNKTALGVEIKSLIDATNAARSNAKRLAEVYNPLLDVYSPLLQQAGEKVDSYKALLKESSSTNGQLCTALSELTSMVIRATKAFLPILDMYEKGELKGFSGPISLAEDNNLRLTGTVKFIREQQAALKCK